MMSQRRQARFEVVVGQNGKTTIDSIFDDEKIALERAHYLLRLVKFPTVRVLRVNQAGKEDVIFERTLPGGSKPITISLINSAAVCNDVLEIFSFDSRMTLLRLLRGYFDDELVIPAEQLHRYPALRGFERKAFLFGPALNRLAGLQAPPLGITPAERLLQLENFFDTLKEMARASGNLAPFDAVLMRDGVTGLWAAAASRPPEERDRIVTHAVGAMLEPHRDWRAKTAAILRLHEPGDGGSTLLIDEFLAETIDGREPVRALIGYAPDLAAALLSLLATLHGDLDKRLPHSEELLALSGAIRSGGGGFLRVREALLRRLCGGLEGHHPLTRTGPEAEGAALQAILERLATFDGYLGGPPMAEALTKRAKIAFGRAGQDLPFEDTVHHLLARLGGPSARIGYLLDLAAGEFGQRKAGYLIQQVADAFGRVQSAAELVPPGVPLREIRDRLDRRLCAAGVPRALIDGLLARMAAASGQSAPSE